MKDDLSNIEFKISQYIDNELQDEEQRELFLLLTEDQRARQMLSEYLQIKKDTFRYYADAPEDVSSIKDGLSVHKLQLNPSVLYKRIFYFSSAAALILLMILSWQQISINKTYKEYNSLKGKYALLQKDFNHFQDKFNHLTLSAEQNSSEQKDENITPELHKKEAKLPIMKKELAAKCEPNKENFIINAQSSRYAYLSKAHVIEVEKNDFLVPQISGN